jgi:hypothetical protein
MIFKMTKLSLLLLALMAVISASNTVFADARLGRIEGYKFHDLNGNGVDNNEPRLPGFRIVLQSVNNPAFLREHITNDQGLFSFIGLPRDRYMVCEIPPVTSPQWIPTTPECLKVNLRGKVPYALIKFGNKQDDQNGGVGCTRTQGYWGSSPAGQQRLIELVGPGMVIGNRNYTAEELDSILDRPVGGNALVNLAHQLIAARLNVLAGADDSQITDELTTAEGLIDGFIIPPVGDPINNFVAPASPLGQQMLVVAEDLDQYNNGNLNVPHCQ